MGVNIVDLREIEGCSGAEEEGRGWREGEGSEG